MRLLTIPFPDIDPVAFAIGPLQVRWYGLAYAATFLLGWRYAKTVLETGHLWRNSRAPFSAERCDDLLLYIMFGVVLGGRIGEVLLYNPAFYFSHPAEILKLWKGGMSFHGGFLGATIATWLFSKQFHIPSILVFDVACAVAPIGTLLVRIANFINGELWGRTSGVAWAMVFPNGGASARHPSQLYEAALEGGVLLLLCWWLIYKKGAFHRPGLITGVFAVGYGSARIFCEFFREPEVVHWANVGFMTPGILYSIPIIVVGMLFLKNSTDRRQLS
jgi:phosphatidylglycerol---prolipoprotein diacylglyceryl transferase